MVGRGARGARGVYVEDRGSKFEPFCMILEVSLPK